MGLRRTSERAQGATYAAAPSSNRLSTVTGAGPRTFTYNTNGSVHTDARTGATYTYGYDPLVRMTGLWNGATQAATYTYNALNQRASKTTGGVTTRFVHNAGGQMLYESGSWPTHHIWIGGQLLGIYRGG